MLGSSSCFLLCAALVILNFALIEIIAFFQLARYVDTEKREIGFNIDVFVTVNAVN